MQSLSSATDTLDHAANRARAGAIRRQAGRWCALIIVAGTVLPWLAGIAVKAVLDLRGKPSFSWTDLEGLMPVLLTMTLDLALSSLVPAFWLWFILVVLTGPARRRHLGEGGRRLFAIGMVTGYSVAILIIYSILFQDFEGASMALLFYGWAIAGAATVTGVLAGTTLVVGRRLRARTPR